MSRNNLRKRLAGARVAYIIGSIVGVIAFGGILSFALSGSTDKEIPEDTGTLGAALNAIIGPNWQTGTLAKVAARLGGVEANYYVRMNSPAGLVCGDVGTLSGLLTRIEQNGSIGCAQQLPNGSTILRPILATIRDLDASCYDQVTVQNTSGTTYSPSNSDPVDIYEGDTITTTPLCSMASLYFIDHSIVRLAPSTTLALRSAGTAGGSGSTDVTLSEGELWARVFKPITDDSYFNVSTEESSVGVRGTSLYVSRKKPSTIYETKIVAVDTGLASATGQVAQLSLSGSTGSLIGLKLAQAVTVQKPLYAPSASITANNTSDSATIYQTFPFTRISTLSDLADFDALKAGVGNLPTIAMTGGWLKSNDIWSSTIAMSAPNGISLSTQKVSDEIARTEPTGTEPTKICIPESTPPSTESTESIVSRVINTIDDGAAVSQSDATVFRIVTSNTEIKESSDCFDPNIIARIERYKQHSGDYKIKGLKTKSIGFRGKDAGEGLDIRDLKDGANKLLSDPNSSWKIQLDAEITTSASTQHLINIGSETQYLRIFLDSSNQIHIQETEGGSPADWTNKFISLPGSTTNLKINLVKSTNKYKLYTEGILVGEVEFNTPIQNIFIGKMFTNNANTYWQGNIQNIQISK